jgi:1,4-dihydroxy-2-naphthoyl-CoA hydrolase
MEEKQAETPEEIGRRALDSMPFASQLGIRLGTLSREEVRGRMEWAPERCTSQGVLHGGALMALADSLGALCAFLNLPPGAGTSTIESKTNFFRAVRSGSVEAISRPLHAGRTTIVAQTDLFDDEGRRVAQVTQTQAVLPARK